MRTTLTLMAGLLLSLVLGAAPGVAADTLGSYPKLTPKQKASAIDAVARKHDVWLEDAQWSAMETCLDDLVAKGPPDRDLDEAINACFGDIVREDQLF